MRGMDLIWSGFVAVKTIVASWNTFAFLEVCGGCIPDGEKIIKVKELTLSCSKTMKRIALLGTTCK